MYEYYGNYSIDARCRLCPEDFLGSGKNGGESFSNFLKDQAKWDEVAKLFCNQLVGTGIEEFEKVRNCAFRVGSLGDAEYITAADIVSGEDVSASVTRL